MVAGGVAWFVLRRPPPDPTAMERARRERLSLTGRITDGSLIDTTTLDGEFVEQASRFPGHGLPPQMLLFQYKIGGVVYEAVQDVSALEEQVRGLRIDLPIQVRYDHLNPADSIVVAEWWSGIQTTQRGEKEVAP